MFLGGTLTFFYYQNFMGTMCPLILNKMQADEYYFRDLKYKQLVTSNMKTIGLT